MLHINFGPSLDTKHLRERRNLELKYKKLSKTQSDIVFLSKCKKFNIVPNGLKLNNPFNSQSTSVKNKGHNICVKAEQRLRNAAINDAYQKQRDLQRDIRTYIQTLKSSSPTNYQQIIEFCESQYRRHKKEFFQRKSPKNFMLCDNHPVLDSAAQFLHKTDNASLSAIHSNVAKFSKLKLSQTHHDLLNLGLSFCPTPRHINPVKVCYNNEQFCRRLRLQEYFPPPKKSGKIALRPAITKRRNGHLLTVEINLLTRL